MSDRPKRPPQGSVKEELDPVFMRAMFVLCDKYGKKKTCEIIQVPYTTFQRWVNGQRFPSDQRKKEIFERVKEYLSNGNTDQ